MSVDTRILDAYVRAALWCDFVKDSAEGTVTRSDGADFDLSCFTKEARDEMREDCEAFVQLAGELLNGLDPAQVGTDFWFTRNRHGAGFWDRGLGERGTKLTDIAHTFSSGLSVYMLRGGKLTVEG